jgi:hypothetical protein
VLAAAVLLLLYSNMLNNSNCIATAGFQWSPAPLLSERMRSPTAKTEPVLCCLDHVMMRCRASHLVLLLFLGIWTCHVHALYFLLDKVVHISVSSFADMLLCYHLQLSSLSYC